MFIKNSQQEDQVDPASYYVLQGHVGSQWDQTYSGTAGATILDQDKLKAL
jgi:hypothetical protein